MSEQKDTQTKEQKNNLLRPKGRQVLWAVGMVVALVTAAFLFINLYPSLWKDLLDARVAKLTGMVVALTVIIILTAIGGRSLEWTGYGEQKLWDWQTLLFVPVTVALIASLITLYQSTRQSEIETLRAQEARELEALRAERDAVQAYLEDMGTFVLEKNLRRAGENDDVRLLARARTLAVLDSVSGDRKVRVLEFVFETELIQFRSDDRLPIISLRFADLRGTRLVKRSILSNTDLDRAELTDARLIDAELINATLTKADLRGANLSGTDLSEADLRGADLRDVKGWSEEQLSEAESLQGATMPDGQTLKSDDMPDGPTFEEWLESKSRKKDGENGSPS